MHLTDPGATPLAADERYRAFVEQSTEGIWCFEFDPPIPGEASTDARMAHALRRGVLRECNDAMARMYGYAHAGELLGSGLAEFAATPDSRNLAFFRAFLESGGRLSDGESRELDRNGAEHVFLNNLVPILEGTAIRRVWGTRRDITEQKRTEAQLVAARRDAERVRERTELLSEAGAILASTLDYEATLAAVARLAVPLFADACIVDVVEPDGRIVHVEAIHSDPAKQALLRELRRRYPPGPTDPSVQAIATRRPVMVDEPTEAMLRQLSGSEEQLRMERAVRPRCGITVPMLARGTALGALSFVRYGTEPYTAADVPFAQELSRRAALALDHSRLYNEALAANRAKGDFLATMSHELRTPLNAVLGYAELLLMGIPAELPVPAQDQVQRIGRATRHLLSIIEEILVFSRIEAGRETVVAEAVELGELVREVSAVVEPLAAEKDLSFTASVPPDGTVLTDGRKLRQILINLLGNAVKFTDSGSVSFVVERDGGGIMFRIADTGLGIAPGELERIWEPFRQVQNPMTRTAGGTGLGLAVSRRLASLLGGEIAVTSAPGVGSTFTLRLPPGDGPGLAAKGDPSLPSPGGLTDD
ncbi:MAG TPA: ATP-binding protein [Longimicrobium sp.]|nr:ATP-binding protein [Longimicrobium sp.]